jgi:hypothetical protein
MPVSLERAQGPFEYPRREWLDPIPIALGGKSKPRQ